MTNEEILAKVKESFPTAVTDVPEGMIDYTIVVAADQLYAVAKYLRDEIGMDYVTDVTAVDYPDYYEVVYHFYSVSRSLGLLTLKVRLEDKEGPELASVTPLWPGAHLMECEVYDLMGINFVGHPDLRRIIMWDGFPGHPLRKDFENRTFTFKELEPTRPKPPDW
jgi:NADH:ubiquinone oxidoreductase subunit C